MKVHTDRRCATEILLTALAGRPLVAGATTQLLKLWRDDFDVIEEDGKHRVCLCDGLTIDQAVAERLASAEYEPHFCLPRLVVGHGRRTRNGPRRAARPTSQKPRRVSRVALGNPPRVPASPPNR